MRPGSGRAAAALGLVAALATGRPAIARPADGGADDAPRAAPAARAGRSDDGAAIKRYFEALERAKLIDVDTGDRDALRREVGAAEELLRAGALIDAAVALYAIVESPRFAGFEDFVEFHNAEYDLGVALARAGAYASALDYFARAIARGPANLYFGPAHRRVVDIALETNDHRGALARLDAIPLDQPLPVEASGERTYLRARAAYAAGDLAAAERSLASISRKSRLYTSALYLRGVIRTRRGDAADAAAALCEIVDQPSDDTFGFVIDDRYFTIRDLARLGLGRLAHEVGDYDDAYYHYFQVPDDSDRLPEALFEAAWSMYQKRELGTARDLTAELQRDFPGTPLAPEAGLLAGYVELADCRFDDAATHYAKLVRELQPVVDELARTRRDPARRAALYARALTRWRAEKQSPDVRLAMPLVTPADKALAYMRLDPAFVRLHDAMAGLRRASGDARLTARAWSGLGARLGGTRVAGVAAESSEAAAAAELHGLRDDVGALSDQIVRARAELRAGGRSGALAPEDVDAELKELGALDRTAAGLSDRIAAAADAADAAVTATAPPGLGALVAADLEEARGLERATADLERRLAAAADAIAIASLDRLLGDIRRVLDKAKLGAIDAVIGQKRKLEIEVQDLAAGRFPAELHGQMWEEGLIGDDEEYWPHQGEYWADEYEGWR